MDILEEVETMDSNELEKAWNEIMKAQPIEQQIRCRIAGYEGRIASLKHIMAMSEREWVE